MFGKYWIVELSWRQDLLQGSISFFLVVWVSIFFAKSCTNLSSRCCKISLDKQKLWHSNKTQCQGITKVSRIHPLRSINKYFTGNLSWTNWLSAQCILPRAMVQMWLKIYCLEEPKWVFFLAVRIGEMKQCRQNTGDLKSVALASSNSQKGSEILTHVAVGITSSVGLQSSSMRHQWFRSSAWKWLCLTNLQPWNHCVSTFWVTEFNGRQSVCLS